MITGQPLRSYTEPNDQENPNDQLPPALLKPSPHLYQSHPRCAARDKGNRRIHFKRPGVFFNCSFSCTREENGTKRRRPVSRELSRTSLICAAHAETRFRSNSPRLLLPLSAISRLVTKGKNHIRTIDLILQGQQPTAA